MTADFGVLSLEKTCPHMCVCVVPQVWFDVHTFQKHNGAQNLYIPVTMSSVRHKFV